MFVQLQMQLYVFSTCHHCVLDAYIQEQVFNKEPGDTSCLTLTSLYTPVPDKLSHLSVKLEFTL